MHNRKILNRLLLFLLTLPVLFFIRSGGGCVASRAGSAGKRGPVSQRSRVGRNGSSESPRLSGTSFMAPHPPLGRLGARACGHGFSSRIACRPAHAKNSAA